jgi:hypothetical protein
VVTSHPVVVTVDVTHVTELVNTAVLVTEVQVTYKSYPVVVLVQELVDDLEFVEVAELVG